MAGKKKTKKKSKAAPVSLRQAMAGELAHSHYQHILLELAKPAELLGRMTVEGVTFEEHARAHLAQLLKEFPGLDTEKTPSGLVNFIRDWYENETRLENYPPYENSTFKIINVNFLDRILFVRDGTRERREILIKNFTELMRTGKFIDRPFSFEYFIRGEAYMRRLLCDRFRDIGLGPAAEVGLIVEEQENAELTSYFTYYHSIAVNERARSEELLRNILPDPIAAELRETGRVEPALYESATVVFTDFEGFTGAASCMTPIELIGKLDQHFRIFDIILQRYGLEKLKTIGDAYMFVGGVPEENPDHAVDCLRAALNIRDYVAEEEPDWPIRIGVHSGPVVAGIVGSSKFSYDVWGDTVNVASRLESGGEPGRINISDATHALVKDRFECCSRGKIPVKNRGEIEMYFVDADCADV